MYYDIWVEVTFRVKAMPMSPLLVKAFAVYGLMTGRPDFGLSVLIAFVGLLRTKDLIRLEMDDCNILGPELMCLTLRLTEDELKKGGKPHPETVLIRDPRIIQAITRRKAAGASKVFNGTDPEFRNVYAGAVRYFGLKHPKPTPHGLRRGGATWHFKLHHSYDRTMEHGRWTQLKIARGYIDEATAEAAKTSLPEAGAARVRDAKLLFKSLFKQTFLDPPIPRD